MSGNIWKTLFLAGVVVYAIHVLTLNRKLKIQEQEYEIYRKQNGRNVRTNTIKKEIHRLQKIMSKSQYTNFKGIIAGREYTYLNETIESAVYKHHIKRLIEIKNSSKLDVAVVVKDFGPKQMHPIRFVNIPHNGLGFANTIVHYSCQKLDDVKVQSVLSNTYSIEYYKADPSCRKYLRQPITKNGQYWSHYPYIEEFDKGNAVALFRTPIERIASQLVGMRQLRAMMTTYGISKAEALVLTNLLTNKFNVTYDSFVRELKGYQNFDKLDKNFFSIAEDCYQKLSKQDVGNRSVEVLEKCRWTMTANFVGMKGCQTRMVLGRNCFDASNELTKDDLALAKMRLENDFLFLGIHEEWNTTVSLFHEQFKGKMFLDELIPQKKKVHSSKKGFIIKSLHDEQYQDLIDEELVSFVIKLFQKRKTKFGL